MQQTKRAKTAIYCRISQDRTMQGLGVERQREDCTNLAQQMGWEVVETLVDNDLSAYSGKKRPSYERLLQGLANGTWSAVIAWHPDRITRSPTELERFIDAVEAAKARVATCKAGEYDLSTAAGRMIARVVGAVARHESEQKSERQARKHVELAAAGRPSGGGRRALGFERDGVTHVPHEVEAIREAAKDILNGVSLGASTRKLNATLGATVTRAGLKGVLCGARVAGLRSHHGTLHPAMWAPIIDADQHLQVIAILHDPERSAKARVVSAQRYTFSGFVHCARCDEPMVSALQHRRANGKKVRRYRCGTCFAGILGETIENHVIDRIGLALDIPHVTEGALPSDHAALKAVHDAEERLTYLATEWGAGRLDALSWGAARKAIEASLDQAREAIVEVAEVTWAHNRAKALFHHGEGSKLAAAWSTMDIDDQRALLAQWIEQIDIAPTIKGDNRRGSVERIAIVWKRGNALSAALAA